MMRFNFSHFLHGNKHVFVELFEWSARRDFPAEFTLSEEVGFVFLYVIEIGWLLFVFAGLHPFAQAFDGEEPVVHDECPSGAGVVAGSQFKKVDVGAFVIFALFFEDVDHVVDFVDCQATAFKPGGFPFRQVPGDGFGGEMRALGYRFHGLIPVLREAQLYFVVDEIEVDNPVDVGLIVSHRAFYSRYFCRAGRDIEYSDVIGQNAFVKVFFAGKDGCQVHGLFQRHDVVNQRGESYLYQPDDRGTEGRKEGTLVGILFHVTLYGFCQNARCLCHLDYFGESHLVEFRRDLLFRDLFRELSEKDCREKDDPVFEVEYLVEIVLFHVYGMLRARLEAFATVYASIFCLSSPSLL